MTRKELEYESDAIIVTYDPKRCIHAEECIHGLPGVFEKDRRPWIDPTQGQADAIAAVVTRCPAGALSFERKDGGPAESAPSQNTAVLAQDGPLYAAGRIEIATSEGVQNETRVAFCRCGASKNKPFCDNSHVEAGFVDTGEIGDGRLVPAGQSSPDAPIGFTAAPNGPLLVNGPLTVRSTDGSQSRSGTKGALCRCGASEKKPFCDGTHNAIGFEAD